ncbi:right-handed parallel beta-helix repeat-containing protein, partial [Candidatus Bathyarchaeota archaeon]|nr:right-handed parallel beta-helix repeat-containing protein [Candidatus Bathyarchaeota archaeon]
FYRSSNNTISGNNITNNRYGIWLEDSSNNTISGNTVRANDNYGVFLDYSSDNMVSGNLLSGNRYGFRVWGHQISHFMHSVDVSNLVDGKPVYYLVNQENLVITPVTHPQIGYLALVNSTGVTVEDVTLTNNGEGLLLAYTNNSTITNNTVTNNYDGIWLWESSNNSVNGNNITNNLGGVYLKYASNNRFYHNNFIDNIAQVLFEDSGYYNIWDNGFPSGGNYWSNYTGVDLNHDGIGDTPHVIDANNTDYYPLMGPIRFFTAGIWKDTTYYVHVVSNSTLPALLPFYFNPDEGAFLRFGVSGETETRGFCRVAIPKDLLWVEDGWTVYYGSVTLDYTTIPDENYTYLYFTYPHYGKSTTTVEIIGTHVIPEFPSFLILPLFMIATLLAAIVHRRKRT